MAIRNIRRQATNPLAASGTPTSSPIYVDSDDNLLKYIPAASGTTEVVVGQFVPSATLTPTAAFALTAAQSGTNVWLNAVAGFAITLPAVANGLNYRFTVAAAFATTNFTIVTPALADIIFGGATVAGADVPADAEDTISFVASAELKGDFVDVWSDGTSWFVNGRGTTAGSITFTTAG
jgi:hypothetical protein